jgi:VLRF1 release factor-like protein
MARYIGRENLRKRLAPLEGEPGRTRYADGVVEIDSVGERLHVRPPFGLAHEARYDSVQLEPLFAALAEDHVVGALLVRLGGFAVGVLEGERLAASKVGSRFVKGRHKKGGWSQNRFRRRREEQERELIDEAAATAVAIFEPWRERIEYVALGGHRPAVDAVLAASPQLAWIRERALPRFFNVTNPRLNVLERLPYEVYSAELVDNETDDD